MNPLERFIRAYIEAALFSSTDNSDDSGGEPLDNNYSRGDLDASALKRIRADCTAFFLANLQDFNGRFEQAGHDFWLTRNGHGAGFWDGDWPEEVGERLTKASEAFGECDIYVGDDRSLYVS